ncbi:VOC family protein [Streptosporangium sp. G11]|uniref:VOC family protein n=1 Tax=Streptosporangium sp. G11 TaxID=3436926 RepID=UPI003EC056E2
MAAGIIPGAISVVVSPLVADVLLPDLSPTSDEGSGRRRSRRLRLQWTPAPRNPSRVAGRDDNSTKTHRIPDHRIKENNIMDLKLEVLVIPVSDVDRAKAFYEKLGFRLDADFPAGDDFRVVQVTPPGSEASIIFGTGVSAAAPGSAQGLHLIVTDVEAARAELLARGAEVSEVWHDADGVFHHAGTANRVAGPHPDRADYGSFASFEDPDGNEWILQEVVTRAPGR